MLKSELFAEREKYSTIFKLTNEVINYIMPYTSYHNINKIETVKKYRILDMRNEYLNSSDKEKGRRAIAEYLHDFQFKLFELNKELISNRTSIEFFDIEKLIKYIEMILHQIKNILLMSKLETAHMYTIADSILELGILCSGFHSYYINLDSLIEKFSIKEEFIYISFYKNENEDLNYSEFLLVANLLNVCIKFLFGEYSDNVHIHIDSGSNYQAKIKASDIAEGEVSVKNSITDNIKEFFKGLISKNKNDSAIMIKTAKSNQELIRNFAKDNINLLKEVTKLKEENEDDFFKQEVIKIYECSSQLSQQNIQISLDSIASKNTSTLLLEKSIVKQIADTNNKEIE